MNPAFPELFDGKRQKGHKVAPVVHEFARSSNKPAEDASPKYYHDQSKGGLEREKLLG